LYINKFTLIARELVFYLFFLVSGKISVSTYTPTPIGSSNGLYTSSKFKT